MTSTDRDSAKKVIPVILSGGSETRLWPLSCTQLSKQLLVMSPERCPLRVTARRRIADTGRFHPPFVICNEEQGLMIAEPLAAPGSAPRDIVLEPVGRDTAAAVAALTVMAEDPEATMPPLVPGPKTELNSLS